MDVTAIENLERKRVGGWEGGGGGVGMDCGDGVRCRVEKDRKGWFRDFEEKRLKGATCVQKEGFLSNMYLMSCHVISCHVNERVTLSWLPSIPILSIPYLPFYLSSLSTLPSLLPVTLSWLLSSYTPSTLTSLSPVAPSYYRAE